MRGVLQVVNVWVAVMHKRDPSSHDVLAVLTDQIWNRAEEVEKNIESMERSENWDMRQTRLSDQVTQECIVHQRKRKGNLCLVAPLRSLVLGEELATLRLCVMSC